MIKRFSVSIEDTLLNKFDKYIESKGYSTRSEAVRDMIRDALIEESINYGENDVFGTITVIYDHEVKGISEKITHLQHGYFGEIRAAVHVHIDEKNCLETLIVHGKAEIIKKIADGLESIKGVKNVKYNLTKVEI